MLTALSLVALLIHAGCDKDTDCKGERICEQGACVAPSLTPAISPAPLPSAATPSVSPQSSAPPGAEPEIPTAVPTAPRKPITACDGANPMDADGRLKPECRVVRQAAVLEPDRPSPQVAVAEDKGKDLKPYGEWGGNDLRIHYVLDVSLPLLMHGLELEFAFTKRWSGGRLGVGVGVGFLNAFMARGLAYAPLTVVGGVRLGSRNELLFRVGVVGAYSMAAFSSLLLAKAMGSVELFRDFLGNGRGMSAAFEVAAGGGTVVLLKLGVVL